MKMSMKRMVIFDLDGTLLNTIDDLATSVNYALSVNGYPTHEVVEYPAFVGNGIDKLIERAMPRNARTHELVMRVKSDFVAYYDEHNAVYTRPYDGINALLMTLQERNVLLAVASNKYHEATLSIIAHYFPSIAFVAVLGQRENFPKKPHPAIVNEILSIAHVDASDVLYVGDSDVDMTTALLAGVESVGVTWGFRSEENLREAGACHIINTPNDLLQLM